MKWTVVKAGVLLSIKESAGDDLLLRGEQGLCSVCILYMFRWRCGLCWGIFLKHEMIITLRVEGKSGWGSQIETCDSRRILSLSSPSHFSLSLLLTHEATPESRSVCFPPAVRLSPPPPRTFQSPPLSHCNFAVHLSSHLGPKSRWLPVSFTRSRVYTRGNCWLGGRGGFFVIKLTCAVLTKQMSKAGLRPGSTVCMTHSFVMHRPVRVILPKRCPGFRPDSLLIHSAVLREKHRHKMAATATALSFE